MFTSSWILIKLRIISSVNLHECNNIFCLFFGFARLFSSIIFSMFIIHKLDVVLVLCWLTSYPSLIVASIYSTGGSDCWLPCHITAPVLSYNSVPPVALYNSRLTLGTYSIHTQQYARHNSIICRCNSGQRLISCGDWPHIMFPCNAYLCKYLSHVLPHDVPAAYIDHSLFSSNNAGPLISTTQLACLPASACFLAVLAIAPTVSWTTCVPVPVLS